MHSELVVLGGGPGGYSAAFLAADLGMQVTLVEAEERLGGVCLLRGCIPSKALLHVAKVMDEARHLNQWGVEFETPSINVEALRARKERVINTLTGGLKQLAAKRKVRVVRARGSFLNSKTLQLEPVAGTPVDEAELTYDHCILATGSTPTRFGPLAIDSPRVMDSTGALELVDIPETLLVVGGGYIGLEMGSVYAELGSRVTVVELTEGLLPGADRELVKPLAARLEKRFESIRLRTRVVGLADRGDSVEVTFEGAGGRTSESFARVLVSVGRRPNTVGIGLENTAVELNERGFVVVDNRRHTTDPHILAIGDVAGEPMLAHKAMHEGKVAVEALHGAAAVFQPQAIPAVVFTDPEIAWAGLSEEQAKEQGIDFEVTRYPWGANGRAQSLGRTDGLTKVVFESETERVLGVGIVGTSAGDLISEAVLAIEMGATARDLAESIHPHPTLSETLGGAGELLLGTATDIYKPRRESRAV